MATNRVTSTTLQVLYQAPLSSTNIRVSSATMQVLRSTADAPAVTQFAVTTTIT